ncbi:hypothetical protein ANO11243_004370 [Dothideomycetidae sp. 11243]|nr:hypothetical protein ANO11243_004370 [fungal sp. No.11243]
MFDNIRSNTQGLANSHTETAKVLKGTVLPILERLHAEIKNKNKELDKGAGKGAKLVDKARNTTQKHVELLGQHSASYESSGGRLAASDDPYVLQRGVYHRLHKQIIEENNNRQDMLSVQNSFSQFEAHVVQTFQDAINQFNQTMANQAEQQRTLYGDVAANTAAIAPNFEWNGFLQRNNGVLIDPNGPPRSMNNVSFPNQNHKSTQPLIAGSLERKGKVIKRYETAFFVVTPSKFMHEFKTDDDFAKDPQPENSLYLPDCTIGALDGVKFQIKGKDSSKGSLGNKFSMTHEYSFHAHTPADAAKWWEVIRSVAGQSSDEMPVSRRTSNEFGDDSAAAARANVQGVPPATAAAHAPTDTSAERAAAGPTQGDLRFASAQQRFYIPSHVHATPVLCQIPYKYFHLSDLPPPFPSLNNIVQD